MQSKDAVAVANTIQHLLVPGGKAIVVSADAKHRFGVDRFESECLRVGLQITISNIAVIQDEVFLESEPKLDRSRQESKKVIPPTIINKSSTSS